jgi:hypothetical protein
MKKIIFIIVIAVVGGFTYLQSGSEKEENLKYDNIEPAYTQTTKEEVTSKSTDQAKDVELKKSDSEVTVANPADFPILKESTPDENDLNKEEMKEITQEVIEEFEALDIPQDLPEDKAERFTILNNSYLKSSYFLNEVAAGNINVKREDLSKAFSAIILFDKENDVSDISDVLNMIEKDSPQVFHGALSELANQKDADRIRTVQELILTEEYPDD